MVKTKKSVKKRNKTKSKEIDLKKRKGEKMAFLESIFNAITDGITVIDINCKITLINQSLIHFYGYKNSKSVIGKKCHEFFQGQKTKCEDCPAIEVFKSGKPQHTSHSRVDKHGNETYWELFFYPIFDEKGKVMNVVEYSKNITREKKLEKEVKGYEKRLADLLSVNRDVIVEYNEDMELTFISKNIKDFSGYTYEEILKAKSFLDFVPPESKKILKKYFKNRIAGKKVPRLYEVEFYHKSGRIIPVEVSVSPKMKGKKVLGAVATIRDITERKETEDELFQLEERFKRIAEGSFDVIFELDSNGRFVYVSPSAKKVTGYMPKEIVGMKIRHFLSKKEINRIKKVFDKFVEHRKFENLEVEISKRDGSSAYLEINPIPIIKSEDIIGILGIARDITQRRKAEEALRESEELYRSLIEASPDAVTVTDLKGKITHVSQRALEIYGSKSMKDLIGKNAFNLIAPEDRDRAMKNLERTLKKGLLKSLEYTIFKKDGSRYIGELSASLVKDASGNPKAFIATTRDITERKQAEEALRFRLAFEELITTFSTHFIYLKTDEIDDGINLALEKIGSFTGVDRSYVFLLSDNGKKMDITHEWCAKGIKSQKDQLQGLDVNTFKWGIDRLKKLFPLDIPKVKDLPPEADADKKVLQSGRIKSFLSVPIVIGGSLFGFIGFASVRKERTWSDEIISMLQILAEIFANALERKRAEEALLESEERYRHIFEKSPIGIGLATFDGDVLTENKAMEEITGYTAEELKKINLNDIYENPEDRNKLVRTINQKGHVADFPARFKRKDGSSYDVLLTISRINLGGKEFLHTICQDITERKKIEEEIKKLKEFNESIVQSMKEGIMILDEEGYVSFINPEIEKILGYKRAKLLGEHWQNIMSPDYHRRMRDCYAENLRGESDRFEAVLLKKDRTELPVLISASPQIKDGTFNGILVVITDISERKKEEIAREELMSYKIKRGSTYLIKEKELERGKEVIYELYKNHFKGVIITREHPDKINREIDIRLPLYWMTNDPRDKMSVKPEFPLLEKIIDDHIDRNTFVFLDRFDYLVSQNSFKDALNFTQHLNEMFYARKAILIISLDPDTLTAQELSLIEKETSVMEKRHEERLSADLLDLLEFVNRYNRVGESPSYKQVGAEFRISRTTARKRIRELVDKGLLMEKKSGRFKYLVLTERGKDTL